MSEIERKTGAVQLRPKYELEPVSWRDAKQQMRDRYNLEMKIETGKRMVIRASAAVDEIRAEMGETDPLKNMFLTSFAFGTAELINDYMTP